MPTLSGLPIFTTQLHNTPSDRANAGTPRILIIRPSALGDVCRTVPALVSLRRAFPNARIDWLINDSFADAIRHHPDLDHTILFPRARFSRCWYQPSVTAELFRWARKLASTRYDLVFDLQGLFRSGLFTRFTRAPRRVGYADARELGWLGYNRRHNIPATLHTVDRMLALLQAEGCPTEPNLQLHTNPHHDRWLDQLLQPSPPTGPAISYACLAPTARWRCKCWPIDHYTRIAQKLLDSRIAGDNIIVLASPDEQPQLQPLRTAFANDPRVLFPRTTIGQMMSAVSRATALICNDSAPLHIAVGFNRPIVALFGPTDPALVGPYHRLDSVLRPPPAANHPTINYRHHRDDQSLIAQITPDQAWDKLLTQLQNFHPQKPTRPDRHP
jgi:lipopolysaccharide heptosyltransferase I